MERWKVGRLISLGKRGRRVEGRKIGREEGWKVDKYGKKGWKEGRLEGWKVGRLISMGKRGGRVEGRKGGKED